MASGSASRNVVHLVHTLHAVQRIRQAGELYDTNMSYKGKKVSLFPVALDFHSDIIQKAARVL